MKWRSGQRSRNVEDRRGMRVGTGLAGGGIGTVVLVLVAMMLGVDPRVVLQGDPSSGAPQSGQPAGPLTAESDSAGQFVSVVLQDTEQTWARIFQEMGKTYEEPGLVLFDGGAVESACGLVPSAAGPFYCPLDQKVNIDLAFYEDLRQKFKAPGDFAQAYVIAHEVGHHVQTLLGISEQVREASSQMRREEANALSVRQELQADCFAGIWAHHAQSKQLLDAGDVEEALNAASAIGDDRMQEKAQGRIAPESFTHGTSAQRMQWFQQGFTSGDVRQCDTFSARQV